MILQLKTKDNKFLKKRKYDKFKDFCIDRVLEETNLKDELEKKSVDEMIFDKVIYMSKDKENLNAMYNNKTSYLKVKKTKFNLKVFNENLKKSDENRFIPQIPTSITPRDKVINLTNGRKSYDFNNKRNSIILSKEYSYSINDPKSINKNQTTYPLDLSINHKESNNKKLLFESTLSSKSKMKDTNNLITYYQKLCCNKHIRNSSFFDICKNTSSFKLPLLKNIGDTNFKKENLKIIEFPRSNLRGNKMIGFKGSTDRMCNKTFFKELLTNKDELNKDFLGTTNRIYNQINVKENLKERLDAFQYSIKKNYLKRLKK